MPLALNVLVSMMSAPAPRYSRWMDAMISGWVRVRRSLLPCTSHAHSANRSPRYPDIGLTPRQAGGLVVQLVRELGHLVVAQGDAVGVERVGLDDVGAGPEVLAVDGRDDLGLGEGEEVVVALHVARPLGEPLAAVP